MSGAETTLSYVGDGSRVSDAAGAGPYLVLVLESARPLAAPVRLALRDVDEVRFGRGERRAVRRVRDGEIERVLIVLPDAWMSSDHARVCFSDGRWWAEDCQSKNGTFLSGQRIERVPLEDGAVIETGSTMFLFRTHSVAVEDFAPEEELSELVSFNPTLQIELERLPRMARAEAPVLILGETGTGKEVIARAVHAHSGREGPFVAINCGALPETLIESELFGVKKGAFSGAVEDREGLVRASDGGTLFLDEIAELPEASQAALLRVLQEKEVMPLGGTRAVKVDLRVVAATHQDVEALVEEGLFRQDLYARLRAFQVALPALRARREDLGMLIGRILPRLCDRPDRVRFTREAARRLLAYDWPLNVRELENALRSALALSDDGMEITAEQLPDDLHRRRRRPSPTPSRAAALGETDEALRRDLVKLLERHGGNVTSVAREMDKARVQIRRWCKRLGIDIDSYRRPASS